MKTVILAGGKGRRMGAGPPKPLTPIGERTLIEHVMSSFAAQGFDDFIVATGFRGEMLNAHLRRAAPPFRVECVDTGEDTENGGRLLALRGRLRAPFFLTWSDGLWDVDLQALLSRHRAAAATATMVVVHPRSRYGVAELEAGLVTRFEEKPHLADRWISAGLFVLEPTALDYLPGPTAKWETTALPALAEDGELAAYRHEGFWLGIDTPVDAEEAEALLRAGRAPWRRG